MAIRGLEQRLVNGFGCRGGYGIFEAHLGRSLLWRRGQGGFTKLCYPPGREVPTWSWMCYLGKITYLDPPFDKVEWSQDVDFPFIPSYYDLKKKYWTTDELGYLLPLTALARNFCFGEARERIIFDTDENHELSRLRCVVVGKDKDWELGGNRLHYVLIIKMESEANIWGHANNRGPYCVRVGVGSMEARHIDLKKPPVNVGIV